MGILFDEGRKKARVFADFHNADIQGRLRLNCIGTIEDLASQHIELQSGQSLTLYSEELEVDGIVQYSEEEDLWVAAIDGNQMREVEGIKIENYAKNDRRHLSKRKNRTD